MKELTPPALNLKRLVKETVPGEPILVVISPGADPSQVSWLSLLFTYQEKDTLRQLVQHFRNTEQLCTFSNFQGCADEITNVVVHGLTVQTHRCFN